jgi:hypothetical protein
MFCEQCRLKHGHSKHPAWPYIGVVEHGKCEYCYKYGPGHEVPKTYLRPEHLKTRNEIVVDKVQQDVYYLKCQELSIYHARSQRIDELATSDLRKLFLYRNGEVDWVATYELRVLARDGYTKSEEFKKSIGG